MTTTRIRPCGEAALLLDCADLAHAVSLARELGHLRPEAVDVVPAARTVLVTARDAAALPALRRRVEQIVAGERQRDGEGEAGLEGRGGGVGEGREGGVGDPGGLAAAERTVTIDVRYDGPDLAFVADLAEVSVEALVRRHTEVVWRAAFGGFAPGFCYLVDSAELDGPGHGHAARRSCEAAPGGGSNGARRSGEAVPALPTVPRLGTPRTLVPAGSVGMADRFCAVYPGASPGGWRLVGRTDAVLWDVERPDPALLVPGDLVRFRDRGGMGGGHGDAAGGCGGATRRGDAGGGNGGGAGP